ncbi:MAG: FkbM family methyltransferase [Streptosporangiaceae bacterium]
MPDTQTAASGRLDHDIRSRVVTSVVMMLARRTHYLESEMLGLDQIVGPGSVCVDVGAAAGLYTLALSRLAGPSGLVHSVEPLAIARPFWTRVLGAESGGNVRHHAVALGGEPGSGTMSVPVGRYGAVTGRSFLTGRSSGLGSNAEFRAHKNIEVTVETLDGLVERAGLPRLDFIKIDVEGAELHVLQGGEQVIEKFRPAVMAEIEARHLERFEYGPQDLVRWLTSRGYQMHVWEGGWRPAEAVTTQFRNYLFRVPKAG